MTTQDFNDVAQSLSAIRAELNGVNAAFREMERVMQKPMGDLARTTVESEKRVDSLNSQMERFNRTLANDFGKAITGAIRNGDGFIGFFEKMRSSLEDLVIQLAVVNPVLNSVFGAQRGTIGDVNGAAAANAGTSHGLFGDLVGGILGLFEARAAGGPVNARQPYLVGERGPELFIPQAAGRIQNHASLHAPVAVTMNISTPDAASFRASQTQIAAAMMDAARRAQRIR